MSVQDAFERILASLYEAMLDDTLWPATSALIDEACGIQGNGIMVGTGPKDAVRALFVGLYYRGERREDWEREYLEVYHPIDESVPRFRQLPDSRLVHVTDLYTAEELKTSLTYNEALHLGSAQNSLRVRLDGPDGSHITWGIHDPVASGGWESSQLTLIKGLLPYIRQFVRVRQALVGAEALGASVADLLDTPRIGVIHLDRRGQIIEANDRARAILRHGDGLSDRGGELRARGPADHAHLEGLLAGALPSAGVGVSGSMLLRRPSGVLPLVVHVKPVVVSPPDYGARRVAVLVLLVEPGRPSRIDPTLVATTLGLTRAESQIAVALAHGQTVREIARTTGRQVSSIHWHLKHIYRKLGVARQAELVQLVRAIIEFA